MSIPLHDRTLARLLQRRATDLGGKPFLLFEGRTYSYAQCLEFSRRIAGGLVAAGIKPNQNVAIMMENSPEVVWLNFALALMGAVAVPVNTAARGDLLAYYIRQSDSVAIFLDSAFLERFGAIRSQCARLEHVVIVDDESEAATPTDRLAIGNALSFKFFSDHEPVEDVLQARFSDILHIMYSSGTTGPAKGSMIANATAVRTAQKHVEVFEYTEDDILYTCLPMFHGNAMNCTVLPALYCGATVAMSRRFSKSQFWREINECGATRTSLLSAMINLLWMNEPSPQERSHRLKTCIVVPTPEFSLEFETRFNVTITTLYGLGDFGYASMMGPSAPRDKIRSAGRILPEVSVAILDDDDFPLPPGVAGQICLRTNEPWFCRQGYYRMEERWFAVIRNLWLHTGDRGWIDQDGYLYFAGRDKELIRRRGENISAIQVEEIMRRHPAIAEVAVYAVRAEFLEDEVMASVVLRDDARMDFIELIAFCAPQMAYFMVPRFVEVIDHFPLTPTGKIEKYKLRDLAQERLAQIWDRERAGIKLEK